MFSCSSDEKGSNAESSFATGDYSLAQATN